jgi:hypothetical protein
MRGSVFDVIKIALSPGLLPLTVLLGLMLVFWLVCLVGAFDFDFIGFSGDHGGFDSGDGGGLADGSTRWLLRFVNADLVPVPAVLSFLLLYEWAAVMMASYLRRPVEGWGEQLTIYALGLLPALLLTKLTTRMMRPMFYALRGIEGEAKPVIGRTGRVRSGVCDEISGQVEVEHPESPLLVNARVAAGAAALVRGTTVTIESFDAEKGVYLVQSHSQTP